MTYCSKSELKPSTRDDVDPLARAVDDVGVVVVVFVCSSSAKRRETRSSTNLLELISEEDCSCWSGVHGFSVAFVSLVDQAEYIAARCVCAFSRWLGVGLSQTGSIFAELGNKGR